MNFLKRYYDKVILLALFVLFIGLMLSVLSIVETTSKIKPEDLKLPERTLDKALYANRAISGDSKFRIAGLWENKAMSWMTAAKGSDPENASDLIKAEKLAICPFCSEKAGNSKVLIPFAAFGGVCPNAECGKALPKPEDNQQALVITANDTDGDGISNEDEKKYGLNAEDERDATYDMDGDGFSNRYEISQKTDPTKANEHPPLWHRLRVVGVRKVELPIKLMVVNTNNSPDKKKWDIQYNLPRTRRGQVRITSNFVALGDEIQVDENDKRSYEIVDVRHVDNVAAAPAGKNGSAAAAAANSNADNSEGESSNVGKFAVKLREVVEPGSKLIPDELEMITGEPVYSSDLRPILQDTGRPKSAMIIRRIGSKIIINRLDGGRSNTMNRYVKKYSEKYRILKVDHKTQSVTLGVVVGIVEDESKLDTVIITPEGQVPAAERVTEGERIANDGAAE